MGLDLAAEHKAHHRFPEKLAFLLNNPVRRRLSPPEKLIAKLNIGAGDTVVDFGCGPGFFTIPLARIAGKAIAVDISQEMLERAKRYAQRNGVPLDLVQSDGTKLDLSNGSVHLILLNHVFHEVEDKQATLREFIRVLKPAGRLAVIEKTRGTRLFSSLGPPIINEDELIRDLKESGFNSVHTLPYGKNSIIIGQVSTNRNS